MPFDSLLSANRVLCKAAGTSKKNVLETISTLIAAGVPEIDADALLQQLISRERLGSTGLGLGVAIPHCRFATKGKTLCALVTLEKPVDFEAIDGQPVDVFFAMLVPEDANETHLQHLAALADVLSQRPEYLTSLRRAKDIPSLLANAIEPFKT